MAYAQVTVTTSPTLIVPPNNARRQLIVENQSASAAVYIGPNPSISTSSTVRLVAGATLEIDGQWFLSALYGVVGSGTATVGYWEHP